MKHPDTSSLTSAKSSRIITDYRQGGLCLHRPPCLHSEVLQMKKGIQKIKTYVKQQSVFVCSAVLAIMLVLWAMLTPASFRHLADSLMTILKEDFSWLYLGVMLGFLLFVLVIAFSKYGNIRLGKEDEKPEYGLVSWFAMLFSAGMGIGMVFWSVAEPLSHYADPMKGIEAGSEEAIYFAVRSCFMHWGMHPWGCYAVMGLALAYFQFRRNKSVLVSNMLAPLFDSKGKTPRGLSCVVDTYTVLLTVIGVATSFGMGCLQISDGLDYLFGIPNTLVTWIVIIAAVSCIYIRSALSGIGKGIKRLSNMNLVLFVVLMVLAFFAGEKSETLRLLVTGLKDYLINFFPDSLRLTSQGDGSWIQNWRVFYWAWWLSWAPFVGIFIARISKGRTIREFVLGVVIVPTLVSVIWFSVFGQLAFHAAGNFSSAQLDALIASPETALFRILQQYSQGIVLCLIAMCLLFTFFVTSADSATYVLAMSSSDGDPEPVKWKKIFWGILIAVLALALILSGEISVIQTVAIVIAFPYLFFLITVGVSLVIDMVCQEKKK